MTFVYLSEPESELTTERWRTTLESGIYQEILIGVAVDEVHCVAEWGSSSSNKIVQRFVLFVCGIFVTSATSIIPYLRHRYGISGDANLFICPVSFPDQLSENALTGKASIIDGDCAVKTVYSLLAQSHNTPFLAPKKFA